MCLIIGDMTSWHRCPLPSDAALGHTCTSRLWPCHPIGMCTTRPMHAIFPASTYGIQVQYLNFYWHGNRIPVVLYIFAITKVFSILNDMESYLIYLVSDRPTYVQPCIIGLAVLVAIECVRTSTATTYWVSYSGASTDIVCNGNVIYITIMHLQCVSRRFQISQYYKLHTCI